MEDRIKVTCNHCNHVITAPRSAAGRRGKCPHCQNSVYVPTPPEELEDIPLADETEPDAGEALDREAQEVAAALRREAGDSQEPATTEAQDVASTVNVADLIVSYLTAMRASKLPEAEAVVAELKTASAQARSKIQQLMVDALQPAGVRDMPAGLYQGLLRKLLDELGD